MLRITQQTNPQQAKRYFTAADYYADGQEIVGGWGGRGAGMLGLAGTVDKASFDQLCDNLDPRTGGALTARTRTDRTVGYDFTFSVPKSVSLLYGLTGDGDVLAAFRGAVAETMREVESEAKARVRKNGRDAERATGNLVWAEYVHTTSRPVDGVPDPHLHAHMFVFNATFDGEERQWKAGQFRDLKRDAPYFQAAFRVRLANRLQELGYALERTRDDFEIAGVPKDVVRRFSRRTAQIDELAADLGITDPDRKAGLGATTREKKADRLTRDELRCEWLGRLSDDDRRALGRAFRPARPKGRVTGGERQAVDHAIGHVFTREAATTERKLVTEALKRGVGAVTLDSVKSELAARPLVRGTVKGRELVTTPDMLSAEGRLLAFARQGRGRYRPLGDPGRPVSRDWLNAGQRKAIRHVLASRDRVTLIRGAAGTGKTTLEQELGEALEAAGRTVVALAPTTPAAGVLRTEAGFAHADTVARFLVDTAMQEHAAGGVVLVDEASLLGTRDMNRLFDTAAAVDARVVLVGDRRQHQAVAAGEPLALLEDKAGLPVAEVTEILRQSGDYKKATAALSEGRVEEAFGELDRLGWVLEVPDGERERALAAEYLKATAARKANGDPKTAIVVSPTHAEGGRITRAVRDALKAEGRLTAERVVPTWVPARLTDPEKADPVNYAPGDLLRFHQNAPGHANGSRRVLGEGEAPPVGFADRFEVFRPGALAVAVGDRLRVTARGTTRDGNHKLANGALLTVQGFTRGGDLVVDHGWVVARDFGHLAHGYVVTSHASQGRTVNTVLVGEAGESLAAADRRQFYVSVSRGTDRTLVFTDDKKELLKAVSRAGEAASATAVATAGRKPPLRPRLRKHVAFINRIATFARTHEPPAHLAHRPMTTDREAARDR